MPGRSTEWTERLTPAAAGPPAQMLAGSSSNRLVAALASRTGQRDTDPLQLPSAGGTSPARCSSKGSWISKCSSLPALPLGSTPNSRPSSSSRSQACPSSSREAAGTAEEEFKRIRGNSPAKTCTVRLPLCQEAKGLKNLYRVVEELAALWDETAATQEQRISDTDAFSAVAVQELQRHVEVWTQRKASLKDRCEALKKRAQDKLRALKQDIHQSTWDELDAIWKEAADMPLEARLGALQEADKRISKQARHLDNMKEAVAESCRIMGLDPSHAGGNMAQLETKMKALKEALLKRRVKAQSVLCVQEHPIEAKDEVEFLKTLNTEVEALEKRVKDLQSSAIRAAIRTRELWEELGEPPQKPRDSEAIRLSADRKPDPNSSLMMTINAKIAAATHESLSTWEGRRRWAEEDLSRLHKALRNFGSLSVVDPFIKDHSTVHSNDRAACQQKLDQVLKEVKTREVPALNHLRQLFEDAGLGSAAFEAFVATLDEATSQEMRAQMIEKETKRVDRYLESICRIRGPLEELRSLVTAAVAFEANVQAGKSRFSGNALHFLEEEKFRRRFAHRYPDLLAGMIDAITAWEADHAGKTFTYHGVEMKEGLLSVKSAPATLVKIPGDLSSMDQVVELLKLASPSQQTAPAAPAPTRKLHRSASTPSPTPKKGSSSTAQQRSPTSSPTKSRRNKRSRSAGALSKEPSPRVSPTAPGLPLPRPPRYPEGVAGGSSACMAAAHIASSIRAPASAGARVY